MKKIFTLYFFMIWMLFNIFSVEKLVLKNNDVYSGSLVLLNNQKVVFLVLEKRFEFKISDIIKIDFSESDSELDIFLDDNSKIKGIIVDQDEDFWTIGSSAGITPIEKKRIKEISNPKFSQYRDPPKKFVFKQNLGIDLNGTFVVNDFSNSFRSYWSIKAYFESNFTLPVYFGFDVSFVMLYPQFGNFNDFLYLIPINFTMKYMDNFYKPQDEKHPIRNLFWHIKFGLGFSPIIFSQIIEDKISISIGFSSEVDYGIKYYVKKFFAIGISGNSGLILEKGNFIFLQSAGLTLEFKF